MRKVEPKDIPTHGERYDVTVTAVGEDKTGRQIVKALIDNGPFKGKRVSDASGGIAAGLHERFSILLYVRVDKGSGRTYVKYAMAEKGPPSAPAEIVLRTPQQKFTRCPPSTPRATTKMTR